MNHHARCRPYYVAGALPPPPPKVTTDGRRFTDSARACLIAITVLAGTDAAIWLTSPQLASARSYDWIESFAPRPVWGAVFAFASAHGIIALTGGGRRRWSANAARVALGVYGAACSMVGASIVVITTIEGRGGLSGASKWWLPTALTIWAFTRPALTTGPHAGHH